MIPIDGPYVPPHIVRVVETPLHPNVYGPYPNVYEPECSCGWRGKRATSRASARVSAWVHVKNAALADDETKP